MPSPTHSPWFYHPNIFYQTNKRNWNLSKLCSKLTSKPNLKVQTKIWWTKKVEIIGSRHTICGLQSAWKEAVFPQLSYNSAICMEGLRKATEALVRPFGALAEVTFGQFLNTNQRDFFWVELLGWIVLSFQANIVIICGNMQQKAPLTFFTLILNHSW
jgi:hypothetical protein